MNNEFGTQAVQQEEKPQMNDVQRLFGVFFSPGKTFQDINRKPSFILPLIVWIVLSLVATAVIMPRIDMEATIQQQIEKSGRSISDAEMEQAVAIGGKFAAIAGYASALFGPILVSLVLGGVFFGLVRLWKGGSTFMKIFSVIIHSFIVQLIKVIVAIPLVIRKESLLAEEAQQIVQSNLSLFFNREETSAALYALASRIDIFSIWTLVLIIIGLTAVSKLNVKQSATISIILWLIYVALTVVVAAIFPS